MFARAGSQYGDDTLFTVKADGTDEHRISDFNGVCCPRWSPDGTMILVPYGDPDGKRLTSGILTPAGTLIRTLPLKPGSLNLVGAAWSANGLLASEGWDDSDPEAGGIYVERASDGGVARRVTSEHGHVQDFTGSGRGILYFEGVPTFPSVGDQQDGSLFTIDIDGGHKRPVTPADMPVENTNHAARISPDGKWIAFASSGSIWKVHPDGSGLSKLFTDPAGGVAVNPTWSPDGTMILFGLDAPGTLATAETPSDNTLSVVRADGSDLTPILVTAGWKREPEWAP